MIKKIKENKLFLIGIVIIGIIFFSYNFVVLHADSAQYCGLASFIGTEKMLTSWVGHRGIIFPLILKIFQPFGIQNVYLMLIMMFLFYLITLFTLYLFYKECKKLFNNKFLNVFFIITTILMVVINPIVFCYTHMLLTEVVGIPLVFLSCYLGLKWIDSKRLKLSVVFFAILTVILYHTKQAFVIGPLSAMLVAGLISCIKNWSWKNFLYRVGSIIVVLIVLVVSIAIWKFAMRNAQDVVEETFEQRVNGRIVRGISRNFTLIGNLSDIDEINMDEIDISDEDKEEIQKIIDGESEYTNFAIYESNSGKYFVYFYTDGSVTEQIPYFFDVLTTSPLDILISYKIGYKKLIFVDGIEDFATELQYIYFKENYVFPMILFGTDANNNNVAYDDDITYDIYREYYSSYETELTENFITKYYNKLEKNLIFTTTFFTKVSLYYAMPFLLLGCLVVFIIRHKKADKNNMRILEMIIVLYGVSFCTLMIYVILAAAIDRYIMPSLIPSYIADTLLVILIVKVIIDKIKSKKILKLEEKIENGVE